MTSALATVTPAEALARPDSGHVPCQGARWLRSWNQPIAVRQRPTRPSGPCEARQSSAESPQKSIGLFNGGIWTGGSDSPNCLIRHSPPPHRSMATLAAF